MKTTFNIKYGMMYKTITNIQEKISCGKVKNLNRNRPKKDKLI